MTERSKNDAGSVSIMLSVPMGRPDYVLSSYEFDVLWARLCPGRVPYPLGVPPTGRTSDERAVLVNEVYRELIARGLVTADREVDDGLVEFLRLLDSHAVSVDLVGDIGYPVRALAVTDGVAGVLAVLAGGELWLTGIGPGELATAAVGLLPPAGSCRTAGRFGVSSGDGEPVAVLVAWYDTDDGRCLVVRGESRVVAGHAEVELQVAAIVSTVADRRLIH